MKKKWNPRRPLAALLLAVFLLAANPFPAGAVTQSEINALKQEAAEIDQQKKALQAELDKLSADISANLEKKQLLDQQIALMEADISNKEEEIETYGNMIEQTEEELADAQEREAAQYELFCKRVRAMEERGKVEYWAVLFRADSFSDLLGRLDIVNEIMEYDQRVIDNLKAIQLEIADTKATLEEQKSASEEAKAQLEVKKGELDDQRDAANALIAQLRKQQGEQEEAMDDLTDEAAAIRAKALELSRQLAAEEEARRRAAAEEAARQAAANGQPAPATTPASTQSNPGGYIWPVNSRYITSTVGGRASPGGIGSTNHKGTDIGRVGYTSSIYAAKAGTVIISAYSSSYGNYVVLSHGSNSTTLYAHMSSRKVSVGQQVKQGDVLGITGSTGNSTGPHLHFEVVENGVLINPLNDGADPKKGYLTGYTLGS